MLRRKNLLDPFVSVSINNSTNAIYLASDGGRLCRPYIIVEKQIPLLTQDQIEVKLLLLLFNFYKIKDVKYGLKTFDDLIAEGCIEFLDVNEINNAQIAVYEKEIVAQTTHLEVLSF